MIFHTRGIFEGGRYDYHDLLIKLGCGKGIYSTPNNLTIVTCHNYKEKTYTERHMDYFGIEYVTLQPDNLDASWVYPIKLSEMRNYIGSCPTEYVLFVDSNDVVFMEDPSVSVSVFESYDCDILFGIAIKKSSRYHSTFMSERRKEIELLRGSGFHLNSGVWIGKTERIGDILETACSYIDDSCWSGSYAEYCKIMKGVGGDPHISFPNWPHGAPDDGDILSWMELDFYPRIGLDVHRKFALREKGRMDSWIIDKVTSI